MSWDRTQTHRRSLSSTTTNSMLSASSPTAAPPSLTTSPWTQRSIRGLGRRLKSRSFHGSSVDKPQAVYNACVNSTLLSGSETWTTYAGKERRLNTLHLRSIRRILGIYILTGQSNTCRCTVSCWSSQYVHPA